MQNQNYTNYATFSHSVPDIAGMSGTLFTSAWVPREVRCRRCTATASMQNMDCVGDAEIAVNYTCPDCGWQLTQHFQDETTGREREHRFKVPPGNT